MGRKTPMFRHFKMHAGKHNIFLHLSICTNLSYYFFCLFNYRLIYNQIITLVLVENKWSTFAWDMKRRQLTIHSAGNKHADWEPYQKVASLLNVALRRCIETFFDGWSVDWPNWATIYKTDTKQPDCTSER